MQKVTQGIHVTMIASYNTFLLYENYIWNHTCITLILYFDLMQSYIMQHGLLIGLNGLSLIGNKNGSCTACFSQYCTSSGNVADSLVLCTPRCVFKRVTWLLKSLVRLSSHCVGWRFIARDFQSILSNKISFDL